MTAAAAADTATLLERLVRKHHCRSTHHFIALDALSRLKGLRADQWKDMLLAEHVWLLKGAKAPDAVFKDFQNHVCHVQEGLWGGAAGKAQEWYARSVEALTKRNWRDAAYALGVLSHYYADPLMPFHTAQTEEEGVIHRAVEWSIAKSRGAIDTIIAATGYPDVVVPEGRGFVADMVLDGAALSNAYYQDFIDHYDFERGVKAPEAGLDDELRAEIAHLIAYATEGFALIIGRAIEEAAVEPPNVNLTLQGYAELLEVPGAMIARGFEQAAEKGAVKRTYREYQKTGKVIRSLSEDDKFIRQLHCRQIRRVALRVLDAEPVAPIGTKHVAASVIQAAAAPESVEPVIAKAVDAAPAPEATAPVKDKKTGAKKAETKAASAPASDDDILFEEARASAPAQPAAPGRQPSLRLEDDIVEAPSIGRKTAKKFQHAKIKTIGDFLALDPEEAAHRVDLHYADASVMRDWQDQTRLMTTVPGLRVHDAQILVGSGIRTREELALAPARTLFQLAREFLSTPEGERVQRDDDRLAEAEIEDWIEAAKAAA